MPAPPMMGASRAQFVKNSRLEIMTLSFILLAVIASPSRMLTANYTRNIGMTFSSPGESRLSSSPLKLVIKYKGSVNGKSMRRI
jgi:hypothetical protein